MIPIKIVNVRDLIRAKVGAAEMVLAYYWGQLNEDGLIDSLFYDAKIRAFKDFRDFCLDRNKHFFVVFINDEVLPIGHFHLTNFAGLTAYVHFSILRRGHGHVSSVEIAKATLVEFFKMRRYSSPLPLAQTLIGVTPTRNKLACRFIKQVGFKPVATIPGACYMHDLDEYTPGLVTVLTADELVS